MKEKGLSHKGQIVTTLFAFNDLLWALLCCFLLIVVLLIAQVQKMKSELTAEDKAAGNISVYVFWRDGIDLDIDTHLLSPRDPHIFYGKVSGKVWNLLRDDLGVIGDDTPRNFENAYTRGMPAGEYVVNIHSYRGQKTMYPVEVEIEVRVTADPNAGKGSTKVVQKKVTLYNTNEEVTGVRFYIDERQNILDVNQLYKSLLGRVQ